MLLDGCSILFLLSVWKSPGDASVVFSIQAIRLWRKCTNLNDSIKNVMSKIEGRRSLLLPDTRNWPPPTSVFLPYNHTSIRRCSPMCFGRELRPSHALGRIGFSPPCQRQSRTLGLNLDCAEVSLFSMQVLAFSSRYKGITAGIFSLLPWMSSFLRAAPQAVFAYAPHCSLHGKLGI